MARSLSEIVAWLVRLEQQIERLSKRLGRWRAPRTRCLIAKTQEGGIPGRTDDTPGSADVELWDFDPDTNDLIAVLDSDDEPVTVTAWNVFGSPVGTTEGTIIQLKEHVSGRLLVDAEDCNVA